MNPKVRDAVQAAIDRCFQMNALCDRMVYIMLGPWYMQRFGSAFHEGVAHAYPAIADKLSDVLLTEHEVVTRGTVVPQAQDYAGPTEMMAEYFNIAESRYISQTVTDPEITGGALRKNEFCSTDGEAQRWAYGYLRAANKTAHTGTIQLLQQSAYAAGSVIDLSGFDEDTNGMWFVWGVDQDAVNARTTLHLRRPLSY